MNVDKELFGAFAFYAGVITVKMMVMGFLTARQRFRTMTFISSEDATRPGEKVSFVRHLMKHFLYLYLDWSE